MPKIITTPKLSNIKIPAILNAQEMLVFIRKQNGKVNY